MKSMKWAGRIGNGDILNRVNGPRLNIANTIRKRKKKWMEHVLRHEFIAGYNGGKSG